MKEPNNLCLRLIILSLLVLIINLWSVHHLGTKLVSIVVVNLPLAFIAIINFFSQILSLKDKSEMKDKVLSWFFFFLKTSVLSTLFILILIMGSIVSSVTVMSSGISDKMAVKLLPEGRNTLIRGKDKRENIGGKEDFKNREKSLNGANDIIRFVRFTTPFGGPFFLQVDGFLRYSFDLYPWIGKKVRVARDMRVTPSVLVRVPTGVQMLLPNGRIVVKSEGKVISDIQTDEKHGSVIVGRNISIPQTFVEKWRLELIVDTDNDTTATSRGLLVWQCPRVVKPLGQIIPGREIEAMFIVNEKLKAQAKIELTNEKIQDILLVDIE